MALVFMDGWQLECCGESFGVGDRVEWMLQSIEDPEWYSAVLGPELAGRLDLREEHHGGVREGDPMTAGVVRSIQAAFCRYGPRPGGDPQTLYPVPGTGRLERLDRADRADFLTRIPSDDEFVGVVIALQT